MNRLKFECRECGGECLEEIMVNVSVYSDISDIVEQDGEFDMEYGNQVNEGGTIEKFQCKDCGAGALSLADLMESGELRSSDQISA